MTTPNTQGASWEEEFDERFGVILEDTIPFSEQYSANDYKDFIRTLLSKERAEGERRGRAEIISVIHGAIQENRDFDGLQDALFNAMRPFYTTLPADSTEDTTNLTT